MKPAFTTLEGKAVDVFFANRVRSRAYNDIVNEIEFLSGCNEDVRVRETRLKDIILDAFNKVDTETWLNTSVEPPLTTIRNALDYLKRYED